MIDRLPRPRTITGAAIAGLSGGCLIVACISVMNVIFPGSAGFSLNGFFAFDASALVGKAAYSNDAYVGLGVALHFAVAIGWALGYAVVATRQKQLITRPIISGAMFGLVVYFAMLLVLVAANLYHTPTPREFGIGLLAHLGFYGIPVALIVARLARPN